MRKGLWAVALAALFAGRLWFGLSSEFFSEDETQIYLMGLRYYATGEWPYFGPDVVWTRSEIPGALQPLLVGLPLRIAPFPESPFILLNVLSFAALAVLSWYIARRVPSVPRWLIWVWVLTAPWTLHFSTHVINPSYVIPAAVLFFLGLFEAIPSLSLGVLSPRLAFLLMGAAITWTMQIHMSWPVLMPYAAVAWLARRRFGPAAMARSAAWLAIGAAIPGLLLAPTLVRYGLHAGSAGSNVAPHLVRPDKILTTLAQFFSFASLEINRFIATDDAKRWAFFEDHLWLVPAAAVVLVAGLVQPIWMLVSWFREPAAPKLATESRERRRAPAVPGWLTMRRLVAFTVALIYGSYWFVAVDPQAHAFYVVAPLAFIFAASCWSIIDSPRRRRVAAVVLGANIILHAALAWLQAPEHSLYRNRAVVAAAIREKQPEMFGHRRPFAINAGPAALRDAARPYDIEDVSVVQETVRVGLGRATVWNVTVANANPRVAFRNLIYLASYYDSEGVLLQRHEDVIKDVLQPGETKTFRLADAIVRTPFHNATFEIAAAEALLPMPTYGLLSRSTPDTTGVRIRARSGSFPP
jgi:hypothetical protein